MSDILSKEKKTHKLHLSRLFCCNHTCRAPTGQGNLISLQGQGKVREFCKMVREIRKSSKVREKSRNFQNYAC